MKVFLTGGTGFLGQQITKKLLQGGWDVTVLVRNPESEAAKKIQAAGAKLVLGDITDRGSMRAPMQDSEIVIHNAAWYELGIPKRKSDLMYKINVEGTRNTLGLAFELGAKKIIYTSTLLVYGHTDNAIAGETFQRRSPPITIYERTKTEAHEIAQQFIQEGAPIVILCPAGIIGPNDKSSTGYLARMYVRHLLPPILLGKTGARSILHVEDAAEAVVQSIEHGRIGETYNLSSGHVQYKDMFNLWKTTPGGCKTTLFWMPESVAVLFCALCEPIQNIFGLSRVFTRELAHIAFVNWNITAEKAEKELGVQFRSIKDAWLDTIESERNLIHQKL